MGSLSDSFLEALPYMPAHRARNSRTRSLNLDTLLDEGRAMSPLDPGALDLVLMGYRFHRAFRQFLHEFNPKPLKPREMEDLLAVAFAALLSRDQTPEHALVFAAVECARSRFGEHVTGLVNAFLRKTTRGKAALLERFTREPQMLLGPELSARWKESPALIERTAKGIASFDATGLFELRPVEAFRDSSHPVQAMDSGSWLLVNECLDRASAITHRPLRVLDACAAPGGKTIALATGFQRQGIEFAMCATESDFKRIERLRGNLGRWRLLEKVETKLFTWGPPSWSTEPGPEGPFDFILADLPCAGTGTFHTRPDLLTEDLVERVNSLRLAQEEILTALRPRLAPSGVMAVSVCSVDPEEVGHISKMLRAKPNFSSFERTEATTEGLTAWFL